MIDFYLKTNNQAELFQIFSDLGMITDDGILIISTLAYSIDDIGEIPGKTGYHCNLRFNDSPTEHQLAIIEPALIQTPNNPFRIWL